MLNFENVNLFEYQFPVTKWFNNFLEIMILFETQKYLVENVLTHTNLQ